MDELILEAFDQAPALIWIADAQGKAIHFNRTWLQFTGASMDEELGNGWRSRVHPDDIADLEVEAEALRRCKPFQSRYRLRRHDGEWRWVLDQGAPIFHPDASLRGFVGTCTDITEQRSAEDELRLERQRLELAQEAAGIGIYDWDIVSGRIVWTREMFRLHGIDASTPGDQIYGIWLEQIHPEDRERADEETRAFVAEAEDLRIEFRILHPTQGLRWIEGRGRMIRGTRGEPLRMIGVNLDVTSRRLAEEALRQSEQRLQDVADNFPGVIVRRVTWPDGRVEYPFFGGSLERFLPTVAEAPAEGWRIEDILRFIHFGDAEEILRRFQKAAEELSNLELEGRVLSRDGTYRWVRSISTPRPREDGALVWDGVILDVTDQHLREGERERASTMLRMAMDVAGIGTWEYDPETGIVTASDVTNRLFSVDVENPSLERYIAAVHPEDRDWVRDSLLKAAADEERLSRDYRLDTSDGIRWISSRASFVELADGSRRLIGALFDVTERKQQEAERLMALDRQTTLLRELSHRVKNNLQMITAMLGLQISRVRDPMSVAELRKVQDRVQAISDLHGLLGYDSGHAEVDFAAYLERLAESFKKSMMTEANVDIRCDADPCMLDADRAVPLGLIVNELLMNSIKHGFPNGRRGSVDLKLECRPEEIWLNVKDSGVGISSGASRPGNLGMRLVEGLIRQLDGRLERAPGPGASYFISMSADRHERD